MIKDEVRLSEYGFAAPESEELANTALWVEVIRTDALLVFNDEEK